MVQSNLVEKARAFATAKHHGQEGKRPHEPYMQHVHNVVELLRRHGGTPEVITGAYLNDCLERTDTTIDELIREFGEEFAELVYWLTDPEDSEGPVKQLLATWLLGRAPLSAKLIKLADIIDNGQAIRSHEPAKF